MRRWAWITMTLAACCPPIELAPPVAPPVASLVPDPEVAPPEPETRRPTLVLSVVIDQLPAWALDRYLEHLPADGLLRRVADRGVYVRRVEYDFAVTNTAPGHAAIYTGAPPSRSGVAGNRVFDAERGARPVIDDGEHAVHGQSNRHASPAVLRLPTVGDALHAQVPGSKVVSVSLKARAAILAGGKTGDLALWYVPQLRGFSSSTFYGPLPPWVAAFNNEHPARSLLEPWEPQDPQLLGRVVGVDDAPGEGDWHGLGVTFPHDPKQAQRPQRVITALPAMTEQLVALAGEAAKTLDLGGDEATDLLAISVSGTDVVGHVFGAESWEYLDHLWVADRALGRLYDQLAKRGEVAVLITSDHGVHPLVERQPEGTAHRVYRKDLRERAEQAADRTLGRGDWIQGLAKPWLVFTPALRNHPRRAQAEAAMDKALVDLPGVAATFTRAEASALATDADRIRRAVGLSVVEGSAGDLFFLLDELSVLDERHPAGKGTAHGTPYRADREVPVLFMGPGVTPTQVVEPLPQARVAATLAALLGVTPPAGVASPPLPGVEVPGGGASTTPSTVVRHDPEEVYRACQANAPACHHALRHTDCNAHREACEAVYEVDFDGDGRREVVVPWFGGVRVYAPDGPGCPTEGPFEHADCGAQLFGRGIDSEPDRDRWVATRVVDVRPGPVLELELHHEGRHWRETMRYRDGAWLADVVR